MMRINVRVALAWVICSGFGATGLGEVPTPTALLTTRIAGNSTAFDVPVVIQGRPYVMLLRTGTWITVLDESLNIPWTLADDSPGNESSEDADHPRRYRSPKMTVRGTEGGVIEFPADQPVVRADLSGLSRQFGSDVHGILGMDFLQAYALDIDFEEGIVRLLDSETLQRHTYDARVAMEISGLRPVVSVRSHDEVYWTLIDVDAFTTHRVNAETYSYLLEEERLEACVYQTDEDDDARDVSDQFGRLHELALGPFVHRDLHARVTTESPSNLGYFYWMRYRCVFDFPGQLVLLNKNAYHDLEDSSDAVGIGFDTESSDQPNSRIALVDVAGVGYRQGVRAGDQLVSIDGRKLSDLSEYAVWWLLSQRWKQVRELVLKRGQEEIRVTLPISARQAAAVSDVGRRDAVRSLAQANGRVPLLKSRIATDGDYLVLPVRVNDEWNDFIVDTATPTSVLDSKFQDMLTPATKSAQRRTRAYGDHSDLYMAHDIEIRGTEGGAIRFPPEKAVACVDLSETRGLSRLDIRGILGMDFLAAYVLEIDFAEGMLRILDQAPKRPEEHHARIPMKLVLGRPMVKLENGTVSFWALVQTGGCMTLAVRRSRFEHLAAAEAIREVPIEHEVDGDVTWWVTGGTGWMRELRLGPFTHPRIHVQQHEEHNLLGQYFLRRYRCTFDFREESLFLDRSPFFDLRDDTNHAGIYLDRGEDPEGNGKRIAYVTLGGEAYWEGVREGDRLLAVDGQEVDELSREVVHRRLMFRQGAPRELLLLRGGDEIRVTIPATKVQSGTKTALDGP